MKNKADFKHSYQSQKNCGRKTQGNESRRGVNAICAPKDMHGGSMSFIKCTSRFLRQLEFKQINDRIRWKNI